MNDPMQEAEKKNQQAMKSIDDGAQRMTDQVGMMFSLPWPRKPLGGHGKGKPGAAPSRPKPVKASARSKSHLRNAKSWPIGNWK